MVRAQVTTKLKILAVTLQASCCRSGCHLVAVHLSQIALVSSPPHNLQISMGFFENFRIELPFHSEAFNEAVNFFKIDFGSFVPTDVIINLQLHACLQETAPEPHPAIPSSSV